MSMAEQVENQIETTSVPETPPELQAYREYVRKVSDAEDAEDLIFNRTIQHAGVIMEFMFAKGKTSIQVLTGELMAAVYGTAEVIRLATAFLRREGATLEIIAEKPIDPQQHPLLVALRKAGLLDRVHLWMAPDGVRNTYPYHFVVVDGKHFRFEQKREVQEAVIQFGQTTFGPKLSTIFSNLKNLSQPTTLAPSAG